MTGPTREDAPASGERLQKILARAGFGSRRAAERLIQEGRVAIDGVPAILGQRTDPSRHAITVDGRPVRLEAAELTLVLHKPDGVLVTASDERGRRTVYDLLEGSPATLRYVGRLDRDTSGVLLLTTDGVLAHRLTHPRYGVEKVYEAEVEGEPSPEALERLRAGVALDDGPTAPAKVELASGGARSTVRLTIHEGRKRQVRRMLAAVGHPVTRLVRTSFGGIELGPLVEGESRPLVPEELESLRRLVRLVD